LLGCWAIVAIGQAALGQVTDAQGGPAPDAGETLGYRVNYRPSDTAPWQVYAQTRSLANANAIADEVKQSGYQAEVVSAATPSPQPYPDAADYSASNYYPTSNFASDYNYYNVPLGGLYNYGWYGGYHPWWGYRARPWYAWNGGNYWHSGWWRGYGWNRGWGAGWHNGWNSAHRLWNENHADRASHEAYFERHDRNAHHTNPSHHATAGHHTPGHQAAAFHGNRGAADHRGTGHFQIGGRNMGRNTSGHHPAGHAAMGHVAGGQHAGGHPSPGGHAAGHHAAHLDP
jgi:hypothetical protein